MAPPSSGMAVVEEWNILVILDLWLDVDVAIATPESLVMIIAF